VCCNKLGLKFKVVSCMYYEIMIELVVGLICNFELLRAIIMCGSGELIFVIK
jgi:hypothetical protein